MARLIYHRDLTITVGDLVRTGLRLRHGMDFNNKAVPTTAPSRAETDATKRALCANAATNSVWALCGPRKSVADARQGA